MLKVRWAGMQSMSLLGDCDLYEEQVLRLVLNMQIGGVCA
jgi:hypothetical protein